MSCRIEINILPREGMPPRTPLSPLTLQKIILRGLYILDSCGDATSNNNVN